MLLSLQELLPLYIAIIEATASIKEIFVKILFPALVVATIIVAHRRMKEGKQSFFNVVSSYITAGGITYLSGEFILSYVPEDLITLSAGIVAFSSEKIVGYLLYTFNVEEWLKHLFNFLLSKKNDL